MAVLSRQAGKDHTGLIAHVCSLGIRGIERIILLHVDRHHDGEDDVVLEVFGDILVRRRIDVDLDETRCAGQSVSIDGLTVQLIGNVEGPRELGCGLRLIHGALEVELRRVGRCLNDYLAVLRCELLVIGHVDDICVITIVRVAVGAIEGDGLHHVRGGNLTIVIKIQIQCFLDTGLCLSGIGDRCEENVFGKAAKNRRCGYRFMKKFLCIDFHNLNSSLLRFTIFTLDDCRM